MRGSERGPQPDCLVVGGDGVGHPALSREHGAEPAVCLRLVRLELNRRPHVLFGLAQPVEAKQHHREILMRHAGRSGSQRILETRDRLSDLPKGNMGEPELPRDGRTPVAAPSIIAVRLPMAKSNRVG